MANDTKYITLENLTRLANKIKADIRLKQDQLQFAELPDADAYTGKVVQYIGEDTTELKAGAFYRSDGTAWVQVSVTETPEPADLPTFTAISDADIEAAFEA